MFICILLIVLYFIKGMEAKCINTMYFTRFRQDMRNEYQSRTLKILFSGL